MPLLGLIMDYGGVLTDGPELLDIPRRARAAGVRTALLSDAHQVPDGCADLFDVVVLGAAAGARKPDPEAFRRVAALLELAPEQCVVVDDLPVNVRGARAAGAVTIRHEDPGTTVAELEILLDLES
ncbi:HAD-IA family hydrolase [Pseudonocardia bannensis]|nr:HAD-IA family hydrolase [Pseudonocardia bannensis]